MPGHAAAAIAAYPELSCTGEQITTDIKGGVNRAIFCASNPKIIPFITDVLDEVLQLFPSKFIHIGGDEVPKEPWKQCDRCQAFITAQGLKDEDELQSDFISEIDKYLDSRGRRLIGWDEILEGGLAEGATVMSWRGVKGGIAAAKARHDVVMSPGTHCYLDHPQADPKTQPRSFPWGYLPIKRVYAYEPIPEELSRDEGKHVLGVQGNVWTEYMPNFRQVQYMAYPRAAALAEVAWSSNEDRNWDEFEKRLTRVHFARLHALGINFCRDALDAPRELPYKPTPASQPSTQPATQPR
jgi:hexosaminidase